MPITEYVKAPTAALHTPQARGRGFAIPDINEAEMGRTLESTPQLRAAYALAQARKYRHHRDCFCRMYQRVACSAADAMWTAKLNAALDEFTKAHR